MATLPKMHGVKSSNIDSIGHDGTDMLVKFKGGATYRYHDVPAETFAKARAAESVGRFVNTHLKGKHTAKKLEDE